MSRLLVLSFLIACTTREESKKTTAAPASQPVAATGDILIGQIGSVSGPQATFGRSSRDGVDLAVKKINAQGGVNGRKLKVLHYDDGGLPENSTQGLTKLVEQDKVLAVIGPESSSNALAAAPIAQKAGVVLITPTGTNPKITQVGDFIFRACYDDDFQGRVMAIFAAEDMKAGKAAILRDAKSDYSQGLANEFIKAFKEFGGEIVKDETYSQGDVHFKAQLTQLKTAKPDVIFVPGYYTDVGLILRQARELGLKMPILGGDGWDSAKLTEIAGKSATDVYFSNHYSSASDAKEVKDFVAEFEAAYNYKPDSHAVMGYDSARLLADALMRVKESTPKALRDALSTTTRFAGVTGLVTIDEKRAVVRPAVVLKVDAGNLQYQTTVNPLK